MSSRASTHPALIENNVAVITGGADGIGLAAAQYFTDLGMRVCIADIDEAKLAEAARGLGDVLALKTDVARIEDVQALKERVYQQYGQVDVLMNNAGTAVHCESWSGYENWQTTLNVNLWGVINGIHCFSTAMMEQNTPGLIINTGSKQGITLPPGNPAYNVSKAAIKAVTETLQHDLRNVDGGQLSAHLLVPGFTYTGIMRQFLDEKPPSAWTSEQVVEFMVASLERGDFYIICPDNDVDRETDNKRMTWAMGDLTDNRPALSRWHPDFQQAFEAFMGK